MNANKTATKDEPSKSDPPGAAPPYSPRKVGYQLAARQSNTAPIASGSEGRYAPGNKRTNSIVANTPATIRHKKRHGNHGAKYQSANSTPAAAMARIEPTRTRV